MQERKMGEAVHMTAQERKHICEEKIKRWMKLRDEVNIAEDDAANIAFSQGSGDPVQSSSISDKTYRGAMILERVEDKRAWVECIEKAMAWLEQERPDIQRLLYGHYGMKYTRGYKRKHARSFADSYCKVYGISMREYHSRRIEGLEEVAYQASEKGLLRNERSV